MHDHCPRPSHNTHNMKQMVATIAMRQCVAPTSARCMITFPVSDYLQVITTWSVTLCTESYAVLTTAPPLD